MIPFSEKTKSIFYFIGITLILVVLKNIPVLKQPIHSYGYDFGFYLHAIQNLNTLNFGLILNSIQGGYLNGIFILNKILNIDNVLFLTLSIQTFSILSCLVLFFQFYKTNKKTAFFSALLLALSIAHNEMVIMFLWKNVTAFPFFILGLFALEKKHYKIFFIASIIVFLFHRTTSIFYLLTIYTYFGFLLWSKKYYKYLSLYLFLPIIFGFLFNTLQNGNLLNFFTNNNLGVKEGLFLNTQNLWQIFWPSLLLSIPGIYLSLRRKENTIWLVLLTITSFWFLLKFPFYRRSLIFLNLSLIIFSAYFLGNIVYNNLYKKIALGIIVLFLFTNYYQYLTSISPLISVKEIKEIQEFQTKNPGDFILSATANDAPWLLGFGKNIRLGAPGLFEDRNTFEEWQMFWGGRNQTEFLWKYPRPLYVYQRSYQIQGQITRCMLPLTENFSEYICKN